MIRNTPPTTIKASEKRMPFFYYEEGTLSYKRVMRRTSVARWAMVTNAARRSERVTIGAAVKTATSEQREKSSFGHRKPARSDKAKVGGS